MLTPCDVMNSDVDRDDVDVDVDVRIAGPIKVDRNIF